MQYYNPGSEIYMFKGMFVQRVEKQVQCIHSGQLFDYKEKELECPSPEEMDEIQ